MLGIPDLYIIALAIIAVLGSSLYCFAVMLNSRLPLSGLYIACAASLFAVALAIMSGYVD